MKIKFLLEGGMAPGAAPTEDPTTAPEAAAAPQGLMNPELALMQLAEMAMQALQNQDCLAAMAVCEGFVLMIQAMQGGGAPLEQPVYRKGGRLAYRIKN